MSSRMWVVWRKEVLDHWRDRRSLGSAALSALIGPLMILMIMFLVGNLIKDRQSRAALPVPVAGRENAPMLVQFLEQNNIRVLDAPPGPQTAVRNGEAEVVLVIPSGYGEELANGRPAQVQLVVDTSRQSTLQTTQRIESLLDSYSNQLGALRLMARGLSPALTRAVSVERIDVSTPTSQVLIFLGSLPYFVVMAVFMGGSAVIIDATAGERERTSLEPLLINPAPRRDLVLGKLFASIPFAVGITLLTLVALGVIFNVLPMEQIVGIPLSLDVGALAGIFLLCLPLVVLAAGLQMIIASYTRTFKEAQTYVTWLPLVPALPGLALGFIPVKPDLWTMLIPTFGQQILMNQFLRGEPVSALNLVVSTVVTVLIAALFVWVAIRLYGREEILFAQP